MHRRQSKHVIVRARAQGFQPSTGPSNVTDIKKGVTGKTNVFDILAFWIQKTKEIHRKNFENVNQKIRQVIKKSNLIYFQKFISSFLLYRTKAFTLDLSNSCIFLKLHHSLLQKTT